MFIVSKKNFIFRLSDGATFPVRRDFMGEVPDYLKEHPLFNIFPGKKIPDVTHQGKAKFPPDLFRAADSLSDLRGKERSDLFRIHCFGFVR